MSSTPQALYSSQLYSLLPAIYRTRDAAQGYPLQALVNVLASQAFLLQDNIDQLYADEFIETCASWVIPYIGDLVGANPIYELGAAIQGRRAEVANTIGYRRRKGTLLALEQVAMDVSGRPALGVEFFKRLITTESMKLVRPDHAATLDLRNGAALAKLDSPFDAISRTVDVRRIAPRVPRTAAADPDATPSRYRAARRRQVQHTRRRRLSLALETSPGAQRAGLPGGYAAIPVQSAGAEYSAV